MKTAPKWACKVLRIVSPEDLLEEIEGDLIQKFHSDITQFGLTRARRRFIWNVIRYIRPGILLRNKLKAQPNSPLMLRTHLKVAFRHIAKGKIYSVLNITGLAIAIATAFLILQYLNFELAFDDFHTNGTKIYRIVTKKHSEREEKTSATTFYGVGTFLKQHFPEVEHVTRFYKWPASTGILMMHGDKIYNERNYVFADPEFFKVFPSLILQGDASTCLDGPNSIVISKKLALKIFGTYDVIGRTVKSLDKHRQELMITAIMPDLPINSNFDLAVIRPCDWIPDTEWDFFNDHTYVLLKDGTSVEEFESRLNFALEKIQRANPYYNGITLSLQNISEIHLHPQSIDELKHPGNKLILYLMGLAFMIVLLVAWVNHVNFEMGRLIQRIKEVALRRIIGSTKRNLIAQFLVQYITIQLIAVLLAGVIVYFVLPYFPIITGIPMRSLHLDIASALLPALGFFMTGILISCVYPSLLLLKTDLTSSLKGKLANAIDKMSVRKTLVIFQFVAALIITSLVIVISQQIELMRKSDLNVSLDRIVTIYNPTNYSAYEDSLRQEKNAVFRNKLMQHVGIDNLTSSSAIPGEPIGFTYVDLAKRTLNDPDRQIPYKVVYIDYDFLPVFDLKLKAGRNYDQRYSDTGSLVVTKSTIRELGFASAAVGKEIYFMEDKWDKWKIIGVVEDYHHEAVKVPVHPTIFRLHRNQGQMVYYSVLLKTSMSPEDAIATIRHEWASVWPEKQFDYFFLDEYYDQQFKAEINFKQTFLSFSCIAIFISCLGLLGITLMMVNVRRKELSIRKVLGATPGQLSMLLSQENLQAIVWSSIISTPLIYWLGSLWLRTYPVRVSITFTAVAIPLLVLAVLIVLTSGIQIVRAANSNPVKYLKSE